MASAEQLKMTHSIDGKVTGVDDRVKVVGEKVEDVHGDVQEVGNRVQTIEGRIEDVRDDVQVVQGNVQDVHCDVRDVGNKVQDVEDNVHDINDRVQGIDSNVRGVDDKLDQANRSFSFSILIIALWAQAASQGTNSKIISYDGSRRRTHQSIITSNAKPITTAQLNGFSKEPYSIGGNRLARSCGYTENVCYS